MVILPSKSPSCEFTEIERKVIFFSFDNNELMLVTIPISSTPITPSVMAYCEVPDFPDQRAGIILYPKREMS